MMVVVSKETFNRVLSKIQDGTAGTNDIHTAVAAEIFMVPVDQVTSGQRNVAKSANYMHLYSN
jgi:DNA polymerase I-like protein with 3'-5' exonuclease and polymerase domains